VSDHLYFKKRYSAVIEELIRLKGIGVSVHYFEGNHDLYLEKYFERELGFKVHTRAAYFSLSGQVVRVEHGDEMDRTDIWYLRLRAFWRSKFMVWLAPRLSGELIAFGGRLASRFSRLFSSGPRRDNSERIKKLIHEHAARSWEKMPFDVFISGHVHLHYVGDAYVSSGRDRLLRPVVNLGSWYDRPRAFLLTAGGGSFIELQ
jgi:UDP-2,3-diacylglucosamine hydrolase